MAGQVALWARRDDARRHPSHPQGPLTVLVGSSTRRPHLGGRARAGLHRPVRFVRGQLPAAARLTCTLPPSGVLLGGCGFVAVVPT